MDNGLIKGRPSPKPSRSLIYPAMDVPSTTLNSTPSAAKPRNKLTLAGRAILDGKIMNTLKKEGKKFMTPQTIGQDSLRAVPICHLSATERN